MMVLKGKYGRILCISLSRVIFCLSGGGVFGVEMVVFKWNQGDFEKRGGCTKKEPAAILPKSMERNIDAWLAGTRTPNLTLPHLTLQVPVSLLFHLSIWDEAK